MLLSIYILSPSSSHPIHPGSAIVGDPTRHESGVLVYFEGNLFGAENLKSYEQRLECAAGRLTHRYPTVAMALLPFDQLVSVGTYDTEAHLLDLSDEDALSAWAGEKVVTGVTRWARDQDLMRQYKDHLRRGIPMGPRH